MIEEIKNEYKLAARQYIRIRSEYNRGRMSGLEAALSWLEVNNDKIREMYQECEEEVKILDGDE